MNCLHLTMITAALTAAVGLATPAQAATGQDAAMLRLAGNAGCLTCHQIEPGGPGPDGQPPIGPSWREVSARYRGQKDAVARLTHTVMSGSNPYDSHWKGKVAGLAMPPNAVAIDEAEARRLVRWILGLAPAGKP